MPKRPSPHRDAVCPHLTINNLFLFRELFQGLRERQTKDEIARELGISKKKIDLLIKAVETSLEIEGEPSGFIRRGAEEKDAAATPAGIFHAGISELLDKLTEVIDDCQTRKNRVLIQGSEFSTLWLLPRVLQQSKYLQTHLDVVLDIRRGYWHRFIANLEKGRIAFAIGPKAPYRPPIEATLLLTVPRALIYHKAHEFACVKQEVDRLKFEHLSQETVFILSGEPIPGLLMKRHLPKPVAGGRHVFIDSISHMYHYVEHNLGVAIGYEYGYGPPHDMSLVRTKKFDELEKMKPAEFFLYYIPQSRLMTPDAEALRKAIEEFATPPGKPNSKSLANRA